MQSLPSSNTPLLRVPTLQGTQTSAPVQRTQTPVQTQSPPQTRPTAPTTPPPPPPSSPPPLSGKALVASFDQRMESLGADRVQANAQQLSGWEKFSNSTFCKGIKFLMGRGTTAEGVQGSVASGTSVGDLVGSDNVSGKVDTSGKAMGGISSSLGIINSGIDIYDSIKGLAEHNNIDKAKELASQAETKMAEAEAKMRETPPNTVAATQLRQEAEQLFKDSMSTRQLGKKERTENQVNLGKSLLSLGTNINSLVNLGADVGGKEILKASTSVASGAFSVVTGTIELGQAGWDIMKASERKARAEAILNPTRENMDLAATKMETRAEKLLAKADKVEAGSFFSKANPSKAAELRKQAAALQAEATALKGMTPEQAKLTSQNVKNIATQMAKGQSIGLKIFSAVKAALSIAAGISLIVLAASNPVGWVLGGIAAVGAIGVGVYKLAKKHQANQEIKAMGQQLAGVQQKLQATGLSDSDKTQLKALEKDITQALNLRSPTFAAHSLLKTLKEVGTDGKPTPEAKEAQRFAQQVLKLDPARLLGTNEDVAAALIVKKMGVS